MSFRGLSLEERVELLGTLLDAWSARESPWQRALAVEHAAHCGFSLPNVRRGLALGLEAWTGKSLDALVRSELPGQASSCLALGFPTTSLLLAGSIPMPTLQSILLPLVLGSRVKVKTASRDPVTATHVLASIRECAPELADAVEISSLDLRDEEELADFLSSPCVLATGSDETIRSVAARVTPPQRLVAYGHRLSVAVIGADSLRGSRLARAARGLALDIALWDQQGCLSPIAVFCIGDFDASLAAGAALAEALEALEQELPRATPSDAEKSQVAQERAAARMRAGAGHGVSVLGEPGPFTVIIEADATPRPVPLARFVRVHPVADAESLLRNLQPYAPHLAGIALAGELPPPVLRALGASRICRPGRLQTPPFAWHHDGQPLLTPLARFSDLELE